MGRKRDTTGEGKGKAPRSDERGAVCVSEPPRFLDDKELTFCIEYSVSGNATSSYQRAYKCGYNTANAHGYKMLSDVVISQTIDTMREERLNRLKVDKDDLIRRILLSYTYDADAFFDDDNRLKPLSELHPDYRCLVEGMDVSEKVTGDDGDGLSRLMKIKLPRRIDAMKLMADHLQMLGNRPKDDDDTPPPPTRVEIVVKDARQ